MVITSHCGRTRLFTVSFLVAFLALGTPVFALNLAAQDRSDDGATPMASPSASPVGAFEGTVTFSAIADTYVMLDRPEENFGDEYELIVDDELRSEAYITFEVTDVRYVVDNATLRLWVTNGTREAPTLWLAPPASWSEMEMTWNTRPALDRPLDARDEKVVEEGMWLEYDVTEVVTENGTYTFALVPESTDGVDMVSRQADEHQPELVLDLGEELAASRPQDEDETPVLLAAGDIASCDDDGAEQTARILDDHQGTIAVLGDSAYADGTEEEFADCYDPTWGRHKDRTMPAIGDRDYNTPSAAPYFEYFGDAAGDPKQAYYSYDLGEWHIVVLNTNIDISKGSLQEEWLRDDLKDSSAMCTLAYWHHPRFSSGEDGANADVEPLFKALHDYGVEVVLSGHDRNYERFAPQDQTGRLDTEFGVRQFVVGTGGLPLGEIEDPLRNSEVRSADANGVLRLQLAEDGYQWEFLAVEGASFYDSGSAPCHDVEEANVHTEIARQADHGPVWLATEPRSISRTFLRRMA